MPRTVRPDKEGAGFVINDDGLEKRYTFEPIETDCEGVDNPAYRVTSETGDVYVVWSDGFGQSCTCADFVFRRDGKDPKGCRHIGALRALKIIPQLVNAGG